MKRDSHGELHASQISNFSVAMSKERWEAQVQDFTAGSCTVGGAVGVQTDTAGQWPLLLVMLGEHTFGYEPELARLFTALDAVGAAGLHERIRGRLRWQSMCSPDGMLARLDLDLWAPVKVRPSFLIAADDYQDIWDVAASGSHLLGLSTKDRLARLPFDASYSDLREACCLIKCEASVSAQMLVRHYKEE